MKIVVLKKKKANGNETENDAQQCEMKCQVTSHLPRKKKERNEKDMPPNQTQASKSHKKFYVR